MTDPRLPHSTLYPAVPPTRSGSRPSLPTPAPRPAVPARTERPEILPGGYALDELPAALRRFCSTLESAGADVLPLDLLRMELDRLELDLQALAPWWIFDAVNYKRNLVRRTAAYEALVLCWLPGQRSPVHDHRGSGCAFRVIEGVATETLYEPAGGDLASPAAMRWLPSGTVCASRDFDIHDVANSDARADLVTLHVYSPPLRDPNLYRGVATRPAS